MLTGNKKSFLNHELIICPLFAVILSITLLMFIILASLIGCVNIGSQEPQVQDTQPQRQGTERSETAQETAASLATEDTPVLPASLNAEAAGNFMADGIISDEEYSGYKDLDGFEVYWANDTDYIYIAMKANAPGFIAVGIQPGRMMKDADIIIGYVDSISVSIYDMYSTGNFGPHPPDIEFGGTDDIIDFDGSEQDGYTMIEFQRLLATGDKYDNDILPGINKIIWAYGNADSTDGSHSKRGYGEIELQ